jgi:hypothetical protein
MEVSANSKKGGTTTRKIGLSRITNRTIQFPRRKQKLLVSSASSGYENQSLLLRFPEVVRTRKGRGVNLRPMMESDRAQGKKAANRSETGANSQKWQNRTVRFGKLKHPVSLGPIQEGNSYPGMFTCLPWSCYSPWTHYYESLHFTWTVPKSHTCDWPSRPYQKYCY